MDRETIGTSNTRIMIEMDHDDENWFRINNYTFTMDGEYVTVSADGEDVDKFWFLSDDPDGFQDECMDWWNSSDDARWLGTI